MYEVYFRDSAGNRRLLDTVDTHEAAIKVIRKFLEEKNFHAPYWRSWVDNENFEWFDVGSHTEFFLIKKI